MRVLYWSEAFWPYIGGIELLSAGLIRALRTYGHEFMVLTSHDYLDLPDRACYQGTPVHRLSFREALISGDLDLYASVRRQVAELKGAFKPDLVHVDGFSPSLLFHLGTVQQHSCPMLFTVHQEIWPSAGAAPDTLMSTALRSADWVVCVSFALLAAVRAWAPEIADRASVVYHVLDLPLEPPKPLPVGRPQLLCLGRLVPAKGFDLALAALASLTDRFPDLHLIVAGDGMARFDLEGQAAELGLDRAVSFRGWVEPDRVPALLNSATMLVMPSRREGLPVVAVQAAMMARPVVGARVAGLQEIIVDGQTGLLVDKDDSASLAEAIASLLEHPEMARQMGQAARRRAQEIFDKARYVEAYDALYKRLVRR